MGDRQCRIDHVEDGNVISRQVAFEFDPKVSPARPREEAGWTAVYSIQTSKIIDGVERRVISTYHVQVERVDMLLPTTEESAAWAIDNANEILALRDRIVHGEIVDG